MYEDFVEGFSVSQSSDSEFSVSRVGNNRLTFIKDGAYPAVAVMDDIYGINFLMPYERMSCVGLGNDNVYFKVSASLLNMNDQHTLFNLATSSSFTMFGNKAWRKNLFFERFSSPGDKYTLSRGYMNRDSEEFSPYTVIPFRNPLIRESFYNNVTQHCEQFGYSSNSEASLHKIPRNRCYRLEYSGSNVVTGTLDDNYWSQHLIPQSDRNYWWITASFINELSPMGYDVDCEINNKKYTFVSASTSGSTIVDYVGMKQNFDPLYYDYYDYYRKTTVDGMFVPEIWTLMSPSSSDLHSILSHTGMKYGFSSWKQIRNREKFVVDLQRKNNIIINQNNSNKINKSSNDVVLYVEPVVSSKFLPLEYTFVGDDNKEYVIRSTFGNEGSLFANSKLNEQTNINKNLNTDLMNKILNNKQFKKLNYKEYIFPSDKFVNTTFTRERYFYGQGLEGEKELIWRDARPNRIPYNPFSSSLGSNICFGSIPTGSSYSICPLDEPALFGMPILETTRYSIGEYQYDVHVSNNLSSNITGNTSGITFLWYSYWNDVDPIVSGSVVEFNNFTSGVLGKGETTLINPPWYDTYKYYANNMHTFKGYGVCPEFKISKFIDFYSSTTGSIYDHETFMVLDGSKIFLNEDKYNFANENWYEIYLNSDSIKHFDVIKKNKTQDTNISSITLKCSGIKQLLPYKGFYPSSRIQQIGTLFSSSFSSYLTGGYEGAIVGSSLDNVPALQTFAQHLFSPGLLMNSIKSGISVGHPVFTSKYSIQTGTIGKIADVPSFWLDFEALLDVSKIPKDTNIYMLYGKNVDTWYSAKLRGGKSTNFEKAMHNFLGEIPKFFLKDNKITSILSSPENEFQVFDSSKTYYMDVVLYNTDNSPCFGTSEGYGTASTQQRGQFFGVPIYSGSTGSSDPMYAAFTPPYYYGTAKAHIAFSPSEKRRYTLDEIFASSSITYSNDWSVALENGNVFDQSLMNERVMQLSSSLNLFGKTKVFEKTWNADGSVKEIIDSKNPNYVWSIAPKMEFPYLVPNEDTSSAMGNSIWLNPSYIPSGSSDGLFFSVQESFDLGKNSGSLVQACGFGKKDALTKRLGEVADAKQISELVIAIPFKETIEQKEFIKIDREIFEKIQKDILNGKEDKNNSIVKMIKSLSNYILPPRYNFIDDKTIDPFIIYTFEFTDRLNKQDLIDAWQNRLPQRETNFRTETVEFTHSIGKEEFFKDEKELNSDLRWVVLKLKKKAEWNYYNTTSDSVDDERFRFQFNLAKNQNQFYSYNWPYDYFSLVELIKIESGFEFSKGK